MDDQSPASQPNPDADAFVLGVPSLLQSWKHHSVLLTHELEETNRELVACRRRVARLVTLHDDDKARIAHQQARITELEAELRRLRDKLVAFTVDEAAGKSAAIYQNAYRGS